MKGVWLKTCLLATAALLSGCLSPRYTKLPTLGWGDPKAEARSYTYHDPLAQPEHGPFVERPRGIGQRAEPRRIVEQYDQVYDQTGSMSTTESAARYPDSVTP